MYNRADGGAREESQLHTSSPCYKPIRERQEKMHPYTSMRICTAQKTFMYSLRIWELRAVAAFPPTPETRKRLALSRILREVDNNHPPGTKARNAIFPRIPHSYFDRLYCALLTTSTRPVKAVLVVSLLWITFFYVYISESKRWKRIQYLSNIIYVFYRLIWYDICSPIQNW